MLNGLADTILPFIDNLTLRLQLKSNRGIQPPATPAPAPPATPAPSPPVPRQGNKRPAPRFFKDDLE